MHNDHKEMSENEIAHKVISVALDVLRALGPGLLESAGMSCLQINSIRA